MDTLPAEVLYYKRLQHIYESEKLSGAGSNASFEEWMDTIDSEIDAVASAPAPLDFSQG